MLFPFQITVDHLYVALKQYKHTVHCKLLTKSGMLYVLRDVLIKQENEMVLETDHGYWQFLME